MSDTSSQQVQEDNWLQELQRIREEAKAQNIQRQVESKTDNAKANKSAELLRRVKGLEFLRDIQKEVLNGQGVIEQFDSKDKYERALALMWDGSISNPSRPKDVEKTEQGILIGVANSRLFVNGEAVSPATPKSVQQILLKTMRNPAKLQRSEIGEDKKGKQGLRGFSKIKWAIILVLLLINFLLVTLGIILLTNTRLITFFVW